MEYLKRYIKRYLWPFTVIGELQLQNDRQSKTIKDIIDRNLRLEQKSYKLEALNDDLNSLMCNIQRAFDRFISANNAEWTKLADKILREVNHGQVMFFIAPIKIDSYLRDEKVDTEKVEMINLKLTMGLSKKCYPEIVAKEIGLKAENAVLAFWRSQSILLKDI